MKFLALLAKEQYYGGVLVPSKSVIFGVFKRFISIFFTFFIFQEQETNFYGCIEWEQF